MEWIEILGIPGAGKTSLLHSLKNNSIHNNMMQTWYAEQTIKYGVIKNITKGNFKLSNKLLQAKFLSSKNLKDAQRWKGLVRIHKEGIELLELPDEFKYQLISFYSNLIAKISKYSTLNLSKPIFLDEGIIYNNYAEKDALYNFIRQNYFIPKLVVYLEADPLEVANEIQDSSSFEARGIKQFKTLSLKGIWNLLQRKDSQIQDRINFLEEIEVPVIRLNRKNCLDISNLTDVNQRINEILKKNL